MQQTQIKNMKVPDKEHELVAGYEFAQETDQHCKLLAYYHKYTVANSIKSVVK